MSNIVRKTFIITLGVFSIIILRGDQVYGQARPNGSVDLITEPSSYTPSFYRGKPLFINQGTMKIIAIPNIIINGKKANSKNLSFKWIKDDVVISSDTTIGNDSVIINGSVPIKDMNVSVQIIDSSGNVLAEDSLAISPANPKVLFYENNSLYGTLFNRALVGSYSLGGKQELSVIAKPYFFDIKDQSDDNISYSWSVNGSPVDSSGQKNVLILRQANTGGIGSADVSVDVNNLARIFQFSNSSFNLNFGQ